MTSRLGWRRDRAPAYSARLCRRAFRRVGYEGGTVMTKRGSPVWQRLLERIELTPGGCWLWTGTKNPRGYGKMTIGGRRGTQKETHRLAYQEFKGEIPDGLVLDHLCEVRHCMNPDHLEPVSRYENMRRGHDYESLRAGGYRRTHCTYGHEYTEDNTYMSWTGRNWAQRCRTCLRAKRRKERAKERP